MAENFDVVVIGAGPAGYVAAIRAAQLKQKVAIVDRQWLGGVCLNVGCIPSKSLLKNAEIAHTLRERGKDFGFSFDNLKLDYGVAVKRSRQNSDRLVKGVGFLMRKNSITVFMGEARLTKPTTVSVKDKEGTTTELTAKNINVATGASAAVPGGWKVDGEKIVTYLEAILQEKLPKSVIVIGSGAIGVEFSTVWNSYGVDVTIVEMLPRLVPLEDEEVSKELKKEFEKRNTKVIGLSVDSLESHKSWMQDIKDVTGHAMNFPLIADQDHKVSGLYGMIHHNANDTLTVRSVFIVGSDNKVKLILTYPISTGRNFDELLRVLDSLQLTSAYMVATPADWKNGDDVIIATSVSDQAARSMFPGFEAKKPYFRVTPQPNK